MAWVHHYIAKGKRLRSRLRRRFGQGSYVSNYRVLGQKIAITHRGSPNDIAAIAGCFRDNQYQIPEVAGGYAELAKNQYAKIVGSGKRPLIIDCGANIGAASLWFRANYPKAQIIAVEPAADNFEYLSRNTAACDVEQLQAGIDATDGSAVLLDPGYGPDGYRMDPNGAGDKIRMVSVSSIISQCPSTSVPFILKVDIEGYEERLFAHQTEALALFPIIIVEPHDWLLPGKGTALSFFAFHCNQKRDYLHSNENVFSIDYHKLSET